MYTSLCLRYGNTLYAMDTALVFHYAVDTLTGYRAYYFLVTARTTLVIVRHSHLPPLALKVFAVHAEQVTGKQCSLVTTRTATYFHYYVLVVLGVSRNQQQLYLLLQFRDALLACRHFLAQHSLHVRIILHGNHLLGILDILQASHIFLAGIHYLAQVLPFLGKLHIPFLVSNDTGVGYQGGNLLKPAYKAIQFL